MQDYQSGSPQARPKEPETSPKSHKERSHGSPQFAHLPALKFKNLLVFALLGYRKFPRKHQRTPKNSLFLPLFSLFQPLLPLFEVLPIVRAAPMLSVLPALHYQAGCKAGSPQPNKPTRKEGTQQGTREREREKAGATSPQANKERDTPPIASWQDAAFLITNSRQKISKKSLGAVMKKFSEKFFGGMFRG